MSDQPVLFSIMAKPVSGICNLDCRYCYYTSKPRELYPELKPADFHMSDEVLESYTRQYIEAMPVRCDFGWQGGEPLLAGMDFFKKAFELQKKYRKPGQTVANALQTNGTLLDDAWCELLAANGALVGLSLDGSPQWHNSFRRDHAGEPSFHRAWAGLELLQKHKVEFNVLVTLNRANVPHGVDLYRYFVNRGVQYLQFIPVLERNADGTPTDYSCTTEQFGRFLLDVFELWASRDIGKVSERFIDNVLHTLIFGNAAMCCHSTRCANGFVLEFNGDLYACDHFVYKEWKIGNIMDRPLSELVRDKRLEEFAQLKSPPDGCRDCEFLSLCNCDCPKHHMPIGTDPARKPYYCEAHKQFFRQCLGDLKSMAEHFKNGQMPPLKAPKSGRIIIPGRKGSRE